MSADDPGEIRRRLRAVEQDAAAGQVERGFEQVDSGFAEIRGKFDATATGQQRIVELIETLIDRNNR